MHPTTLHPQRLRSAVIVKNAGILASYLYAHPRGGYHGDMGQQKDLAGISWNENVREFAVAGPAVLWGVDAPRQDVQEGNALGRPGSRTLCSGALPWAQRLKDHAPRRRSGTTCWSRPAFPPASGPSAVSGGVRCEDWWDLSDEVLPGVLVTKPTGRKFRRTGAAVPTRKHPPPLVCSFIPPLVPYASAAGRREKLRRKDERDGLGPPVLPQLTVQRLHLPRVNVGDRIGQLLALLVS